MITGKRIVIIAGPNGAGKSTFAVDYLQNEDCPRFVNADQLAAGLSRFEPDLTAVQAGKVMLKAIEDNTKRGHSFAFETTLSGRGHARSIVKWRQRGYRVTLVFLRLPSPEMAMARVRQRVAEGGHAVPEATVRRRFRAGWRNFETLYRDLVDEWLLYDNSGAEPILVAEGKRP